MESKQRRRALRQMGRAIDLINDASELLAEGGRKEEAETVGNLVGMVAIAMATIHMGENEE